MQVITSNRHITLRGEEGERVTLRADTLQGDLPQAGKTTHTLELSVESGEYYFRTMLNPRESSELREFMAASYRDAVQQSLSFSGEQGERLVFRHSNMGEPYREGLDVRVEGVAQYPDYLGPFLESSEVRRARDFLRQQHQS